ncbi:hypothetical protein [Hymenobacter persicinus]|uniref:hypothetical protein n=1 Tax=Hymenobacter persicinus TaxID=2025506 RepID=UPI0013EC0D00|nr:hypothetical protein [Hymenobacter persicinus]
MLDVQVSLKYEIGDDPCRSVVSGRDLCAAYEHAKWLTWIALGVVLALIGCSHQLVRNK